MTRVLVTGDRDWTAASPIRALMRQMPPGSTVIHGGARGADALAGKLAAEYNHGVMSYPAEWAKYGRAGGPLRNKQMLDEGMPDVVIAFHDDLSRSKGTRDMLRQAHRAGIEWRVYDSQGRLAPRREVLPLLA